jgi:DNA-binding transcriptional MerR regulator
VARNRDRYLRASDVADLLNISTSTLKRYLRKKKIAEPNRDPDTNYRLWTPEHVRQIQEALSHSSEKELK